MEENMRKELPLLCLYTSKSAFLLRLAYTIPSPFSREAQGVTVEAIEPFEGYLLSSLPSTRIIRIRSAPRSVQGYGTFSPSGSMAMLTNEYALLMYHPRNQLITNPVRFVMEDLIEDQPISDFCFLKPSTPMDEAALMNSLSILLLQESGSVLAASPILFDETVVSSMLLDKTNDLLDEEEEETMKSDEDEAWKRAKIRQLTAAKRFIQDAFGTQTNQPGGPNYRTARIRTVSEMSSTLWPVRVQGPLIPMLQDEHLDTTRALRIEQFATGIDMANGFVIGRTNHSLSWGILSSTKVLPRFAYEEKDDEMILNDHICGAAAIVERVRITSSQGEENQDSQDTFAIIPDPVVSTMLHYVTSRRVSSISSNALQVTARKLQTDARGARVVFSRQPIKTNTWSTISLSSSQSELHGVAISGDAHLGHVALCRLSNGTFESVNMTRKYYFFEDDETDDGTEEKKDASLDQQLPGFGAPFKEVVEPIFQRIIKGLSGMSVVVGKSTKTKDVNADSLALFLERQSHCENEIVVPLRELRHMTKVQFKVLKEIHKLQLQQIESLKQSMELLTSRVTEWKDRALAAELKAKELSEQSAAVLQTCHDGLPRVTTAEIQYIDLLTDYEKKCEKWEDEVDRVGKDVIAFVENTKPVDIALSEVELKQCHALQNGSTVKLTNSEKQLRGAEDDVNELADRLGMVLAPKSSKMK